MRKALPLLVLCLALDWSFSSAAQEAAGDGDDLDQQLESLKAGIIDATPGFYVSPLVSAAYLNGSFEQQGLSFDFDGYLIRGGVVVGYQLAPLRMDVQANIGQSKIDVDGIDGKIDVTSYDVTVNGYYDLPIDIGALIHQGMPMITPYVGAGLGWVYLDVEDTSGDGGVLTQGLAGVGVRLSPHWTLDVGYRYLYIPRIEPGEADDEIDAQSAEFKLRYRF